MLTIYLVLVAGTTLFGFLFTPDERVSQGNLWVSVLAVCLLVVVRIRSLFEIIVHTIMALLVMLTVYTATQTGGINSTAVVWLNVLSVAVLLLLGRMATLVWIGLDGSHLDGLGGRSCQCVLFCDDLGLAQPLARAREPDDGGAHL
jgi:hypothetical protein